MSNADVNAWMQEGARKQRRWDLIGAIAGGVALLVGFAVVLFVQCNGVPAGDERVHAALEAQGFHGEQLFGADIGACAQDESSHHFTAKNASGARVEGTVCCGLTGVGKGCTVRWGR